MDQDQLGKGVRAGVLPVGGSEGEQKKEPYHLNPVVPRLSVVRCLCVSRPGEFLVLSDSGVLRVVFGVPLLTFTALFLQSVCR